MRAQPHICLYCLLLSQEGARAVVSLAGNCAAAAKRFSVQCAAETLSKPKARGLLQLPPVPLLESQKKHLHRES